MKPSALFAVLAVVLLAGLVYVDLQLGSAKSEIKQLKAANAAADSRLGAMQAAVDGFRAELKRYESVIGPQGTLQTLAKNLESGDMELSVKSLAIVSRGKPVVALKSVPDAGGVIQVSAGDGSSLAEIASGPGKTRLGLRATTGADPAVVVHLAALGADGLTLQKGPTEDPAARTDGAGFQIGDDGSDLFLAQGSGGNVSIATSTGDERAKLSLWAEGAPKKVIYASIGARDINPFLSVSGNAAGFSLTLLPDRLSLATGGGSVALAAAEDADGGYVFANDKTGARRAIMTAGTDGHGSITVFGSDSRSNTLYPEYNIQRTGATQK